jgi:hypothetical protein
MHPTISDMGQSIDKYFTNNFVEVTDPLNRSSGKQIFVSKNRQERFQEIFNSRNVSYNHLYIYKQLASLKGAGIFNSMFSRYTVLSRMLPIEGGQIIYCVWHGRVYITDIKIQLDYKFTKGAKNIPAGLYRVRKNADTNKKWMLDLKDDAVIQIDQLRTKHLAINGHCEDIADAARYMPAFIQYGHGESTLKDTYSLFFNPSQGVVRGDWRALRDSTGISGTQAAQKLAAVLSTNGQKNMDVNLTVHESGHALLKEALRIVNRDMKVRLDRFTVFYANPTHNLELVDKWRARTGMQLAQKPPLINTVSAQQFILSGNAVSGPVLAFKANSPDRMASLYNTLAAGLGAYGVHSVGQGLLGAATWGMGVAPFLLGTHRGLNKQVIDTNGKAVQEGIRSYRKLVWDPVHKMMVRG